MLNLILWLLFGGIVGWLASIVMGRNAQMGILLNIVVGVIGAALGGFLFGLLTGNTSTINSNDFSLGSLLISFIGAVVLLGIVNLFTRGTAR